MLIAILIFSIILICIGFYSAYKHRYKRFEEIEWNYGNGVTIIGLVFGFTFLVLSLFAMPIVTVYLIDCKNLDIKIEFLEENNVELENKIYETVEQYCIYENKVMQDISADKPELILLLYPELKANELFNSYIATLRENNAEIKELTLNKLNEKVYQWWLYFGS